MSRKKRPEGHVNHERWLVSYADFITLLFAFFVVLYSASQVDHKKVGRLAQAIESAFQQMGIFQASSARPPLDMSEPVPAADPKLVATIEKQITMGRIPPPAKGAFNSPENGSLGSLQKELEEALAPEIRRKVVALRQEPDGLVVSLREVGFFPSGSATMRADSAPSFGRIVEVLRKRNNRIRIEGHTDRIPIHTAQFQSNWELSTARATNLVRMLIERYGFAPERLSAVGYAEFHPVAGNDDEGGRQTNRRVDVVILSPERPRVQNLLPDGPESPHGPAAGGSR